MVEQTKARGRHVFRRLAFTLTVISLLAGLQAGAVAASHSLLFVVDSSAAMAPFMDGVKDTMLSYAEQSDRGDYLGIISFSNTAKLLALKKVTGPSDRKSLEIMFEALIPQGDDPADIDRGLERALEEVTTLRRRGDKNAKGILIISASVLPEDRSTESLENALQEMSKLVAGDEWYIQYCYLNGMRDARIAQFVANNNGFSYDIDKLCNEHKTELIAELYKIAIIPEKSCPTTAADMDGAVLKKSSQPSEEWTSVKPGEKLEEGSHLNVADNSRLVLAVEHFGKMGLAPATEIVLERARRNPISGRADIDVRLDAGSAWMHMGTNLATLHANFDGNTVDISGRADARIRAGDSGDIEVASPSGALSVKPTGTTTESITLRQNQETVAKAGRTLTPVEPADARVIEEWKDWKKVLLNAVPLAQVVFAMPEVVFPTESITLGPLLSGGELNRTFPVRLVNIPDASRLKVAIDVAVALPKGVSVSTALLDGEKPDTKELVLNFDGTEGFSSGRNEEHKGLLKISPSPDSPIKFERVSVPMTIVTSTKLISKTILLLGAVALCVGAVGLIATRLYRKKEAVRPHPHRVIGRLVIIEDPTRGRIGSINLEEVSTKSSRLSLSVGRDRTAEIRLKHASVQPTHCVIEAHLMGDHLLTYIEPFASAAVMVNNEVIRSRTRLNDGDRIAIGDFLYQFEDLQFYKKVSVVYSNGRRITGVLDASGMDAEGFKISPMDAVSPSERARVKFSDIRSVTFYRRAADILAKKPRPQAKHGMKRVELMFRRGDTVSGYIQREYTEGRQRFVELLPLESSSDVDYTVVEYSAVVEKKVI